MAIIDIPNDTPGPVPRFSSEQPPSYYTLQGDQYEKLRRVVIGRFEQSENANRNQFEKFNRWEKLVHMVTKKKQYDWKANVFLPYPFAVSEQSAAMKWLALMMQRPILSVNPRTVGRIPGLTEIAERRQALCDWHLTGGGDLDVQETTPDMFRISERYGTAIALVAPKWDPRKMRYRSLKEIPTAMGPISRMMWKMRQTRDYRIQLTPLDNVTVYPQPGFRDINGPRGMRYIHRKYWLTKDELLELQEAHLMGPDVGGMDVNEVTDTKGPDLDEFKERRRYISQGEDVFSVHDQFDQIVELIEYQGSVPRELVDPQTAEYEDKMGLNPYNRLVVFANKDVCIENIALPWDHGLKSYVKMDCVPDPDNFWGKGKIEPNEHMTYAANETVNMRLDNVKALVNSLVAVYGAKMPAGWKRRLVSQPFGVVETMGPPAEVISRINLGDVNQSAYVEQRNFWTLIQEAASVNETLIGAPGPKRTLGEHQLKAESASKRLQFELVVQAKQLLCPPNGLAAFIIGLDRQYLPIPTYVRVINPDTPDSFTEIEMDYDMFAHEDEMFVYSATGATEGINQASRRGDWITLSQLLAPALPLLLQNGMDLLEFVRMSMKLFNFEFSRLFPMGKQGMLPMGGMAPQGGMMPPEGAGAPAGMPPQPMTAGMMPPPMAGGGLPPNAVESAGALQSALGAIYGQ